jgi:CheY-like chemotaxis protein
MTRRRILVVDDDDDLRSGVVEILRDEGWEVREARHGAEALDAMATFAPAVMLLDYRMPVMDGGEVLRRLDGVTPPPSVVLMTASAHVHALAAQHGLRFYVPKPFGIDELLETVDRARAAA